ncbi:hypothetical protein J7T55_007622 [Diaporthe amygdali]|uniref:uncharacterized protein n=1 Tax=Phomopsis amygdali TaxID=1214568 RepID=UPI0022FE496A|nr:uncharacterized protein J7T55_007622 [Diaporthe amygdali]KAJ0107252.1 hypothetical protein J7T55_007622 [Diaporthe amygdali]
MDVPLAEDREFAMLDEHQIDTLNAVERMGATLSLFGIMLIFITFALFRRLRTIPNTFIFFASVANIGACVACLIAYDGIQAMSRDRKSALCQAQGFLFEWFMQSDPWWSFAMAINVYMVFFMSFNPTTFRQYLWLYCLICFGLPAIPSFVFLFLREDRGLVYGDAALWCWISSDWNALRIYSYYLPIWICTVLSAVIYFAVGYHVFHQRNQLRNLSLSNQAKDVEIDVEVTCDSSDVRDSAEKNLTSHAGPGFYGTVTTEVQVTSATIPTSTNPAYTSPFLEPSETTHHNGPAKRRIDTTHLRVNTSLGQESSPRLGTPAPNAPGGFLPIHTHNYPWSREPSSVSAGTVDILSPSVTLVNSNDSSSYGFPKASACGQEHNFENISFNGTQFTSTISAGTASKDDYDRDPSPSRALPPLSANVSPCSGARRLQQPTAPVIKMRRRLNIFQRIARGTRRFGAKLRNMDPVKLAYLRTSFVFAISVLVTWTPSSINRVYTLVYPNQASYGLNIAAAVVLPLQGVWNAVIYFTTSWKIFREEMETTRAGLRVLEFLRLDSGAEGTRQSTGGSFAIGSSVMTPRSEMGRNRRLDGESGDGNDMELVATTSPQRPRPAQRTSTMRVTRKGLDDFS